MCNKIRKIMKLSKVKFQDIPKNQELTKEEQKLIFGGYSGSYFCFYEKSIGNASNPGCTNNRTEAYSSVVQGGYWCCDCSAAQSFCWY